jgi:hypothetical protein
VRDDDADHTVNEPSPAELEFSAALGRLLRGRAERAAAWQLSRAVRARFEALRADGMLDRSFHV